MKKRGIEDIEKVCGGQTVHYRSAPHIIGNYCIAGEKEGQGPLKEYFDLVIDDCYFGEKTHEQAEQKMYENAISGAIKSSKLAKGDVKMMMAGDLLNQIISSSFTARSFDAMFVGLYGACSTMALSLAVGSLFVDGGYVDNVVVCAGSHFATAERQYRTPLELGNQRSPLSQWTVTGVGSSVLCHPKKLPAGHAPNGKTVVVTGATFGKVHDFGVKDVNNMGAAMAPAAAATIMAHFKDTGATPADYDAIFTGDLGKLGEELLRKMLGDNGYVMDARYNDCGRLVFDEKQNLYQGGSGCGCSAITFNGFIMNKLRRGEYRRVLFVATGALLSPVSSYQGETIPGIAHAVVIESR